MGVQLVVLKYVMWWGVKVGEHEIRTSGTILLFLQETEVVES